MALRGWILPMALSFAGAAQATPYVEQFEGAFPAWESGWFGTWSDALNYYCNARGCTERGNNPDGLWLAGVAGGVEPIEVSFTHSFAAGIQSLTLDVAGFATTTLRAYDVANTLIFEQAVTLTYGAFTDPGVYATYTITSTNGIDRFTFDGSASGNTSIDNIRVNAVPEPQTYLMMALGLAAVGGLVRRRQRA